MKATIDDFEIIEKHRLGKTYLVIRSKNNKKNIKRFRDKTIKDIEFAKQWLVDAIWSSNKISEFIELFENNKIDLPKFDENIKVTLRRYRP